MLDGSGGRLNSGDGGMRSMGGQQQQQQQRGPGNSRIILQFIESQVVYIY